MNAITAILGAVLNSLWAAAILAAGVWAALRLAGPRVNAATRHAVWWIALAAVIVLPMMPRRAAKTTPVAARPSVSGPVSRNLAAQTVPPFVGPQSDAVVTVSNRGRAWWPWLALLAWGSVCAGSVFRMARSYVHLRGWKRRAQVWDRALPGSRRGVRVLTSEEIGSPVAAGFVAPAVIVPARLREQLNAEEMDCVLLHEAAHLDRFDDWENLAARVAKAVVGLHPVCWWLLRQIDRERESACDEWVVARTGAARQYARSLARVIELRLEPAGSALAAGIFEKRSRLRARIEMLLERGRPFSATVTRRTALLAAGAAFALSAAGTLAPRWIAFAQKKQFEVASVKMVEGRPPEWHMEPTRSGDRVTMHGTRVFTMIYWAFHLHDGYQFADEEKGDVQWIWYDIDARTPEGTSDDDLRLMFQTLLEDRFQLKTHRETRQVAEFVLTLGKGEPKLKPAEDGDSLKLTIEGRTFKEPAGTCSGSLWVEGQHTVCHAVTMDQFARQLSGELRAPLVDRTGLTGTYDINLLHARTNGKDRDEAGPLPTLQEAVEKQLGLKLEMSKGPVEVLVVDHYQRPSAN